MKRAIFFITTILTCLALTAQVDGNGWTILDPSTAEKVIYVSNTSGNDTTGIVYEYPNEQIGSNPILPENSIFAFKTVESAVSSIEDGTAAWILFKRGDTFTGGIPVISGKSSTQPFLYHSYGTRLKSPLFLTGTDPGIEKDGSVQHFWMVGLNFYAHTRDPDNPAFITGDEGEDGIKIQLTKPGQTLNNILVEGNVFRFYKGNLIQDFDELGTSTSIVLRRNIILDSYYPIPKTIDKNNQSVGLFTASLSNLILDENIFDHNGWLIRSDDEGKDFTRGQATIENHNTYFKNAKNMVFKNNSFHRPSSIGTKWTANSGVASAQNITIENNLYDDCNIAISIGGNTRDTAFRFNNINIINNIISRPGHTDYTNRKTSNGFNVEDWNTGVISDNLFINQMVSERSGFGLSLRRTSKDVNIEKNIFYNLKNIKAIDVMENAVFTNYNVKNNSFSGTSEFKQFVTLPTTPTTGLTFSKNSYLQASTQNTPFKIAGNNISFEAWQNIWPDENVNATEIKYLDPTRDFESYVTQVLGYYSTSKFYKKLRNMDYLRWHSDFSAIAINNWIREGFEVVANVNFISNTLDNHDDSIKALVFPNPVEDILTLDFGTTDKQYLITVFNAQGEKTESKLSQKPKESIDTSNFQKGFFIVQIESGEHIKRIKLIKN